MWKKPAVVADALSVAQLGGDEHAASWLNLQVNPWADGVKEGVPTIKSMESLPFVYPFVCLFPCFSCEGKTTKNPPYFSLVFGHYGTVCVCLCVCVAGILVIKTVMWEANALGGALINKNRPGGAFLGLLAQIGSTNSPNLSKHNPLLIYSLEKHRVMHEVRIAFQVFWIRVDFIVFLLFI